MKNPLVSVITTTKNREKETERLLKSIKSQSYKNIEIVVVDNFSTDNTKEIAKKYTNSVYSKGPERSTQRNFAVEKAKGKYVLILDSDMILTPNIVSECVDVIQKNKNIGAIVIPEKSFGKGYWAKVKALEREMNVGEKYFEAARFFPKKVFLRHEGYDTTLTGPEDWDLPQRISKKMKIERIKAYIKHNEGKLTLLGLMKKKYYYGLSVHKYLKKQRMPVLGPKTVYFLRSGFYKNYKKLFKDPLVSFGLIVMLLFESIGGGLGYIVGRFIKQ